MTRRFSSQELRVLRNRVPIGQVIETLIGLACQKKTASCHSAAPYAAVLTLPSMPLIILQDALRAGKNLIPLNLSCISLRSTLSRVSNG
jgi:hypothetical protein